MTTSKQEKIEEFTSALQKVIDIRCEIVRETDRCNHRYVVTELKPIYEDRKKVLQEILKDLLT